MRQQFLSVSDVALLAGVDSNTVRKNAGGAELPVAAIGGGTERLFDPLVGIRFALGRTLKINIPDVIDAAVVRKVRDAVSKSTGPQLAAAYRAVAAFMALLGDSDADDIGREIAVKLARRTPTDLGLAHGDDVQKLAAGGNVRK
jgi:hypothetical protein